MDFIGHVPAGYKVCVSTREYVDPKYRTTQFYRWLYRKWS